MRASYRFLLASFLVSSAFGVGCGDSGTGPSTPGAPAEPDFPRGDYELIVESFAPSGVRTFVAMAADGTGVGAFAAAPSDAVFLAPSPDGSRIAFLRPTIDGDQHLWMMDRDGSNAEAIVAGTILIEHVAWSPDGTRLAISGSTLDDTDEIWTLDPDGTDMVKIAADPPLAVIFDRHPSWSPDGTRIAFQSNRSGIARLHVMDADGANVRLVSPEVEQSEVTPVWSPDGQRIAFVVLGQGIGFVAPDGSGRRIVSSPDAPTRLAWTPDGRLLFSARLFGDRDVFVLDSPDGAPVNLTQRTGPDVSVVALPYVAPPAWLGFEGARVADLGGAIGDDFADLVAGDVIDDGRVDLVLLDPAASRLVVLRQQSSGAFVMHATPTFEGAQLEAASADFSRDGIDDLVLLSENSLRVWRGGPLDLAAPTTHEFEGAASGMAWGDFDRDGWNDVAGLHRRPGTGVRMLVHGTNPDGDLLAILDYPSNFLDPGRAVAGDVTGDGAIDVVLVTARDTAPVVILPGQGDITFGAGYAATNAIDGDGDAVPRLADLDGDRRDDLILTHPATGASMHVFLAAGSGFAVPTNTGVAAVAVVAADFDRDADVDLVASDGENTFVFLRNRGNGVFARPVGLPLDGLARAPRLLEAVDVDGDGWIDVAAVDATRKVAVFTNLRR